MKSTPGYCSLSALGTTNGEILGWDGLNTNSQRRETVRQAVLLRFNQLLNGEVASDDLKVRQARTSQTRKDKRRQMASH